MDEAIIDALYRASAAGVPIDIWVRGICAVKPGQPGLSETIRVRSILGRYLEHARIFSFVNNGDPVVYIGSADMMHRNLDRRVEALVRLVAPDQLRQIDELFNLALDDETSSWWLDQEGEWVRHSRSESGEPLQDMQNVIMKRISGRRRSVTR
ncbi:MAG: degradosome polyphosphate kinase [Microbacteriaceae bacterium]|nr:degradosome polyphosphate kinase [Microbacteriaceae bacterium]